VINLLYEICIIALYIRISQFKTDFDYYSILVFSRCGTNVAITVIGH